ncbi:MAG: electron transport complex subunit RsxC [Bacteroidales bacterium]|nr:electron transport complex subunit RsxC [Bacteroidales bacterium]
MRTFRIGGVHPPENKLSAGQIIEEIGLPKQVIIPLAQNLGAPSTAIVNKGDEVKVGTIIGRSSGFVSSNLHSSVSGKVAKVDQSLDASGYRRPSVFIDVIGDEWEESIDRSTNLKNECDLSAEEILKKIGEFGIVGLGGATFPTQVKLMPLPGKKAEILIINAVECEPYLTSDHALMMEKSDEIMVGIQILMKAINVTRTVIGIENNKPDAIVLMTQKALKYKGVEVMQLKVQYPQGGEKQLIDAVIRRQVPNGALPIATGAIVQNVATAFAVYEAIQKNKPLIDRVVTVTGKSIVKPSNYKARIGIPMQMLMDAAGGLPEDTGKIISGGPMMGKAIVSLDIPVVKGTSGILVLPDFESQRAKMKNCIRCSKCVSVCPMGLEPYLLGSIGEMQLWDRAEKEDVMNCIECGCCSYTCPSGRPLVDFIRLGKTKVSAIIRARK